jgi:hypothetical protein
VVAAVRLARACERVYKEAESAGGTGNPRINAAAEAAFLAVMKASPYDVKFEPTRTGLVLCSRLGKAVCCDVPLGVSANRSARSSSHR